MRSGSLFSGVLGLDAAVTAVFGTELAWTCDNDPAAAKVIAHHYPDVPNLGDITTVDWDSVEPVDILTGGFPCTDVSAAGRRAGMHEGTRSGLWAHMAHAIARLRPQIVVIENVRGLLTSRGAEPTDELLAAWAERDKAARILRLINSKLRRARREGKREHVHYHARDRDRFVGRHRAAVAAAKRADALIVRAIGAVLGTLADLGFDAAWCGLPASAVGAPHERFRIFILAVDTTADPKGDGRHEGWPEPAGQQRGSDAPLGGGAAPADAAGPRRSRHLADAAVARDGAAAAIAREVQPGGLNRAPANADYIGPARAGGTRGRWPRSADGGGDAPTDSDGAGLERREPAAGHDLPAGGTLADASAGGWRPGEPDLRTWESDTAGSGYARPAPHPDGDGREVVQRVESGVGSREDTDGRGEIDWGIYTAAIQRWERVVGRPAPVPRVVGPRGGLKLSPALTEWMQGFPAGWITDVPGVGMNDALRLAGNSVMPRQAEAALRWLITQLEGP